MGGRGGVSGIGGAVTQKGIKALESMGAKRWTKGGNDRLYLKAAGAALMGLDVDRYKSGNISSARRNGEKISNRTASRIIDTYSQSYVDLKTGEVKAVGPGPYRDEFISAVKKKLRKR